MSIFSVSKRTPTIDQLLRTTTCVCQVKHITAVGTGTRKRKTNSPAGNHNTDNLHNHSITADFNLSRKGRRTRPPFPSTYPIAGVQFKYAWSVITVWRQVRLSLAIFRNNGQFREPAVCGTRSCRKTKVLVCAPTHFLARPPPADSLFISRIVSCPSRARLSLHTETR